MPETFTPAAAAKALGVHSNTIRAACGEWAPYLSAGAVPASGGARVLTLADLAVLQIVFDCRREGLSREATIKRVEGAPPSPYIDPPAVSIAVTDPPSSLQAATGADLAGVVALLADVLRERDERLIGRIEATERRGAGLLLGVAVIVMIAFAAGGLAVLVLLRLAG